MWLNNTKTDIFVVIKIVAVLVVVRPFVLIPPVTSSEGFEPTPSPAVAEVVAKSKSGVRAVVE